MTDNKNDALSNKLIDDSNLSTSFSNEKENIFEVQDYALNNTDETNESEDNGTIVIDKNIKFDLINRFVVNRQQPIFQNGVKCYFGEILSFDKDNVVIDALIDDRRTIVNISKDSFPEFELDYLKVGTKLIIKTFFERRGSWKGMLYNSSQIIIRRFNKHNNEINDGQYKTDEIINMFSENGTI